MSRITSKLSLFKYVKERLGHKNVQVTMQVYQHLTKKISANGTEILQNMYKK